ncbi:MAG: phage minor capsid protein [Muribaculum sp.]|nr:phage minor capsid protein [Muribaculum sp.]
MGARNTGTGHANHKKWQGKVYYIKEIEGKDYAEEAARIGQESIESLWEATGYSADGTQENDPLGLYGYNCRHKHYAWFEGVSEILPSEPDPDPVVIDGKEYDYYAATQRMRSMERAVRALKREREALKALGMEEDAKTVTAKIRSKIKEYEKFCEAAGIKPKSNRMRYESGTSDLTKTKAWKRYEGMNGGLAAGIMDGVPVHKAPEEIGILTDRTPDSIKSKLEEYEKLIVDETVENALVIEKDGTITQCFGDLNRVYLGVDLGDRLRGSYVTHNHPLGSNNEYSFSDDDINLFIDYDLEVLRGIDEKYIYELTRNADDIDEPIYFSEATEYDLRHSIILELARSLQIGYRRWLRDSGTD